MVKHPTLRHLGWLKGFVGCARLLCRALSMGLSMSSLVCGVVLGRRIGVRLGAGKVHGYVVPIVRPRVTELREMSTILDPDGVGDPDENKLLAHELLVKAWQLFDLRDRFVLVLDQPGVGVVVHGPFGTVNELKKAASSTIVAAGPERAKAAVFRLLGDTTEGLLLC